MNSVSTSENPWWSPKALEEQERQIRQGAEGIPTSFASDFATYRALVLGSDPEDCRLDEHNSYLDAEIQLLCRDYYRLMERYGQHRPRYIADFGCGAGFTTAGLASVWPEAEVHGFDVSHDAVEFAQGRWPNCRFFARALAPEQKIAHQYDLILCQEFYPFSRTASAEVHGQWLQLLDSVLTSEGIAIIVVPGGNAESINQSYELLRGRYRLKRWSLVNPRISRFMPFWCSVWCGKILRALYSSRVRGVYVLEPRIASGKH